MRWFTAASTSENQLYTGTALPTVRPLFPSNARGVEPRSPAKELTAGYALSRRHRRGKRASGRRDQQQPSSQLRKRPTYATLHLGRAVFGHGPRSVHLALPPLVEVSGLEPPTSTLRKWIVAVL